MTQGELFPQDPSVPDLIEAGALFYISHSGGKDSQAMYAILSTQIPHHQIAVVHSDLGEVEWEGVQDHIRATIRHPLIVTRATKTFFEMVRHRARTRPEVPAWPAAATRQCTSDLKRGPIQRAIRRDMKERGQLLAVSCMGLRAQESAARAKRSVWAPNKALSKAGRTVWDWNPIHALTTEQVFDTIRQAGQEPFWAYRAGNKRLSCVFCILGCDNDLRNGRKHRPELYEQYVQLERETGWTMFHEKSLADRMEGGEEDPRDQPPQEVCCP